VNVSYIAAYRNWSQSGGSVAGALQVPTPGQFGEPATRWQCLNNGSATTGNQWPIWLPNTNNIATAVLPDQFLGIALTADLNNIITTLSINTPVIPPQPQTTAGAPTNVNAHYLVLALVGLVLLILLIVVAVKAFTRPH